MFSLLQQAVTSTVLTASNVPTTDAPVWSSGTTYSLGDQVVILGDVNMIYESSQDNNTALDPTAGIGWFIVGAINRYKAFDDELSSVTVGSGSTITYTLEPTQYCNVMTFFRMQATSLRVIVRDGSDSVIFDKSVALLDTRRIRTFTDYIDPIPRLTSIVFMGRDTQGRSFVVLPGYSVEITIDAGSGTPSVGVIQLGRMLSLGVSDTSTKAAFRSFSTVQFSQFGILNVVRRPGTRDLRGSMIVQKDSTGYVLDLLEELQGAITSWWTHEEFALTGTGIVGLLVDFNADFSRGTISQISLEIQGVS